MLRALKQHKHWNQSRRLLHTVQDPFGDAPHREPRRVVVTGLGLVTPLGIGVEATWSRLLDGDCGIRKLNAEDIPEEQRPAFDALPCRIAACVDQGRFSEFCSQAGVHVDASREPKFVQYAVAAAAQAIKDSGCLQDGTGNMEQIGVAIGSGMSFTADLGRAGQIVGAGQPRKLSPWLVPRVLANMAAGVVSMRYGLQGPNHAVSTACTTGAHAIGDAYNFVRHGDARVMIAGVLAFSSVVYPRVMRRPLETFGSRTAYLWLGGTESCIDAISIGAFARMKALQTKRNEDPTTSSRPFDASRGGFVMGEGAGVVVLEDLQSALDRNAHIYAEVRGYGLSSDAHHVAQPPPDGHGAFLAMQNALRYSDIDKKHVAYLNAHATSTPLGDAVEAMAIEKLFGTNHSNGNKNLLVSSTKGATGHLLGAAGAVEAIFAILALDRHIAPATLNHEKEDPAILGSRLVRNVPCDLQEGPKAVLSNSFGFGGTNASLIFATSPSRN